MALEALALSGQGLEEVGWAGSAGSQAAVGIHARRAAGAALVLRASAGPGGEGVLRAGEALLETLGGRLVGVAVAGALQTGHESLGAVGAVAAHGDAVRLGLGALGLGPEAGGAGLALALPGLVLEGSLGTQRAGSLALAGEEARGAFQAPVSDKCELHKE